MCLFVFYCFLLLLLLFFNVLSPHRLFLSSGPVEGEEECNYNGTVYRIGDTFTRDCSLCMCVHGNSVNCSFNSCPPTELPVPSILCPFPHVRHDGCCDTVFCMEENVGQWAVTSSCRALARLRQNLSRTPV